MDNYLVEFDDEKIPNNELQSQTDYDIKVITKLEPTNNENNDDILETYEDHMDHVHKLFTKLKKTDSTTHQEKIAILTKLENIKTKYPHINCQYITINDDLEKIKKIYNNFRLDVIKQLSKEIEKENKKVHISESIINNSSGTTHNVITNLFDILNTTFEGNDLTTNEFLEKEKLKKDKNIETITSKIIKLQKIINNKKNNKKGCTYPEDLQVDKLTKKLHKVIGINNNSSESDDDSDICSKSSDDDLINCSVEYSDTSDEEYHQK